MAQKIQSGDENGLQEACGVFGCVATGCWPTDLDVGHCIVLGLVGLQHRYRYLLSLSWAKGSVIFKTIRVRGGGMSVIFGVVNMPYLLIFIVGESALFTLNSFS